MGARGPTPKSTRSRARDQRRRESELRVVEVDEEVRGPGLPEFGWWLPGEGLQEWPPETVAWWESWRRSPQARLFLETDWSFLLDTALLHAEYWVGNRSVGAELRMRVAKFGATPDDRARLKIAVVGGDPPAPARRPGSRSRKQRLLRAVGEEGVSDG